MSNRILEIDYAGRPLLFTSYADRAPAVITWDNACPTFSFHRQTCDASFPSQVAFARLFVGKITKI